MELMDGTSLTIPKDALASLEGHWIIENKGVVPDILVDAPPDEAVTQNDWELDVAVKKALEAIRKSPPLRFKAPAPLPAYPPAGSEPGASFDGPSSDCVSSAGKEKWSCKN
jgi:tricorn protease